jgi:hypothetical protein
LLSFIFLLGSQSLWGQVSFSYIYPLDGTDKHYPEQNIILRSNLNIDPASLTTASFSLEASKSGDHVFEPLLSNDRRTLLLKPARPFSQGETVTFKYLGGVETEQGLPLNEATIHFRIIEHEPDEVWSRLEQFEREKSETDTLLMDAYPFPLNDNNLPDDYPPVNIVNQVDHDNEYFFLNMNSRFNNLPWKKYISIVDSYGIPVYYNKSEFNRINFDILPNGLLCYAINTVPNSNREKYFIMDSTFTVIDSVNTGNGYILDAHDMLLLENGHYLVMSYDPQPVDMSQVVTGGDPDAIVTGLVIQEVDNDENVYFQWRSWDHFEITDATPDINLLGRNIDYVHGNAFAIDMDGNILLSSRHLDEITKIDFNSGEIIWRFGMNSENNMFDIYSDTIGFSHQHDIRLLYNGHYTIYDNGNLNNPPVSRALEYSINETELTAVLSWSYHHPTQLFSDFAGGFKVLNNGQRIIGWGGTYPLSSTVVDLDGNIEQQVFLPDYISSYRAFKYPWETRSFETEPLLSLGNAAGYSESKVNRLYVFNTSSKGIKITSIHHHDTAFKVLSELPLAIFPGNYKYIEIGFDADISGEHDDRFTLNFDNADNSERIARQLRISAYLDEEIPSVTIHPSYGTENISPDTVLTVTFNEAVTKIFGGDIQNEDIPALIELKEEYFRGEDVTFSGAINEEKTTISIYPDQPLKENHEYYIRLKANKLKDYDGNIIKLAEESYFETGMMTGTPEHKYDPVRIYPNPAREDVMLEITPGEFSLIKVYNLHGMLIEQISITKASTRVSMSGMPAGIYFIQFLDEEQKISYTEKLLKQ